MTVAIVDYGSGNLRSAAQAFERAAREAGTHERVLVTSDPREVAAADRIVLPGVGAFADCRAGLYAVPGMVEALQREVIERAKPFLGICVGMQLMATRGVEYGVHAGLDWIAGDVVRIEPEDIRKKGRVPKNARDGPRPRRLWRAGHCHGRPRQSRRHTVPS